MLNAKGTETHYWSSISRGISVIKFSALSYGPGGRDVALRNLGCPLYKPWASL